jgi:hypothetical protein
MKIGRGNRSTRREPAPAPLCPPQIPNPTWPDSGSNPSLRGGKPATKRLSCGTAKPVACKAYSLTLKVETLHFRNVSNILPDYKAYISEDYILYNHRRENLKPHITWYTHCRKLLSKNKCYTNVFRAFTIPWWRGLTLTDVIPSRWGIMLIQHRSIRCDCSSSRHIAAWESCAPLQQTERR